VPFGHSSQWYASSWPVSFLHLIECLYWELTASR
jgi:hypothetical protein